MTNLRPRERRLIVDTSAFFALFDERDSNHGAALAIQRRLVSERWRLYTTNWLVAETHALTLNRLGRRTAARALQDLDRSAELSALALVRVTAADERRARAIVAQYDDKDFSLTDAASFAVAERLGISYAFSFDHHFAQYGLHLLEG